MDWEQLREKTLGEVGTALVTEGAGTAGGFVGAAFVGRQIQNFVMPDANIAGSITNGAMAWAANNLPKVAIWYLTRKYAIEPGETVTPGKEIISDARKAFAGSVVFDTLMRLSNGGANPATASLFGWQVLGSGPGQSPEAQKSMQADVQRLIQENSALRAELNKALQRLATPAVPPAPQAPPVQAVVQAPPQAPHVQVAPAPVTHVAPAPAPVVQAQPITQPPVVRYQPVAPPAAPVVRPAPVAQPAPIRRAEEVTPYTSQPIPPAVSERERRYGFMENVTPPAVQERQKKYGFMRGSGEEKEIAQMFGML